MKFRCENNEAIPVGDYVGRFVGVHLQDATNPTYKPARGKDGQPLPPGAVWEWEILEGPQAGKIADRLTGPTCSPKSECTRLAETLTGKRWADGAEFDLGPLVGTLWRFRVDPREGGTGTRVSLTGMARAYDLEKNGGAPPALDPNPNDPDALSMFVKFGGNREALPMSYGVVQASVKTRVIQLSDPAAWPGDPKWRTVGELLQEVTTGKRTAAAASA